MAIPTFVDQVTLHVAAGRGGHGVASVHREKFKPLGGPDGGNGGPGGSVILRVDPDVTTLVDYHHSPKRRAENGGHGAGAHRNGGHGADLVLPVPDGTVVRDRTTGEVLADLVGPGTELVVAEGGRGGLGNAALASSKRKAPGFALLGEPGDELEILLELKVVADIGLVGFPSAGKSSLIAAISRARPKIADYPFTTLVPNLGVVRAGDVTFTVADVPGLIEGASEGRGLGHEFLRHVERCAALVHVVDTATMEPGRNPMDDLDVIERELTNHGGLEDRPRLVALNKIDVPDGRDISDIVIDDLRERGLRVFPVSAASGEGLRELTFAMAELVANARAAAPGRRGDPDRAAAAERRRRRRLHGRAHRRRRLAGARRQARALGPADRLQQRRGRRLPRRPARPARRRGRAAQARRPGGRRRPHRPRRQLRGLRLQAQRRRRRRDARPARRGPALRRVAPGPPSAAARSTRRWTSARRARPAPTWPAGSGTRSGPPSRPARRRTRSARGRPRRRLEPRRGLGR